MNKNQIDFSYTGTKPSDTPADTIRRRKTTKEQIQDALAIQNDYKNRNIGTDPDREEDEYFCFIGKYPR